MASFNKLILCGYCGKDPELRYSTDGTPICTVSVASTERKKDKGGEYRDVTTWFRCTLWRRQAELASQYLTKGSQVYFEGRLTQNEYQDRDGNTKTSLELNVTEMHFLSKSEGQAASAGAGESRQQGFYKPPAEDEDDSIPF